MNQTPHQTTHHQSTPLGDDHVTVTVVRKVIPGQEKNYEQWISGISNAAARYPGHLGVHILRPSMGYNQYTVIYRYDTQEHADAWHNSDERRQWTDKLIGITEGDTDIRSVSGLESWFDLPTIPATQHPIRWRMCVVLATVVYIMLTALNLLLTPLLSDWHPYARMALIVCLQVTLMTYIVMPKVTALLKNWLYR